MRRPAKATGWRGAYLTGLTGGDPWGFRYSANTIFLTTASNAGAGIAVGPILGGWATTEYSWRIIFAGEVLLVALILVMTPKVADAVKVAMERAGITDPADVHYVQTKTPLLTIDTIRDARERGETTILEEPHGSMDISNGTTALGIAVALGEIEMPKQEQVMRDLSLFSAVASCSSGVELDRAQIVVVGNARGHGGNYKVGHSVMKDALDQDGIWEAIRNDPRHQALPPASLELDVADLATRIGMSYMGIKGICLDLEKRGLLVGLDTFRDDMQADIQRGHDVPDEDLPPFPRPPPRDGTPICWCPEGRRSSTTSFPASRSWAGTPSASAATPSSTSTTTRLRTSWSRSRRRSVTAASAKSCASSHGAPTSSKGRVVPRPSEIITPSNSTVPG